MKYILIVLFLLSILVCFNTYQNRNVEKGSSCLNDHIAEIAQCE